MARHGDDIVRHIRDDWWVVDRHGSWVGPYPNEVDADHQATVLGLWDDDGIDVDVMRNARG